ncbi:lipoprotein-releasing ABC transporter permease subunit [Litorilituus lipolyticus]|uniref:Lipoprotein-releasing ABC transporter permease subunit n=1 Tax=Litorilituus lipolyticus TaxID=2491017 RepID=A0A502L0A3_9GAMM|nr:lipoprotein-releasing ABC transporter permease subunit [Litorilituus lipolyticus]TPH13887.1 lipoprotein-releasing ABC transporter permease subunit [Litorilituus lipolyticus]
MFQPLSIFIGLRYSRSRSHTGFVSFITFFSIAGILLGVASLITVSSVMNGFEGELKKRILGIIPHVVVSTQNITHSPQNFSWHEKREALLKEPHVKQVTPFIETEALIQSPTSLQGVMLQGILPEYEKENIINTHMVSGQLSDLSKQPYSVVLGESLANNLRIGVGEEVRLILPNKTVFTPMGRVPVQRVFTVSGIFNVGSQVDDAMIYIHSNYGAKLLRRKGDGIDSLRLYLDDAFNEKIVAQSLLKNTEFQKMNITTWDQTQGVLFSAVKMEKNMMWLMLSLIVAVAAFNIVSALVMVVIDKQGEIGILRTLGLQRIDVVKIFITQGMVNGLWGVFIGSALGILLTINLNSILAFLGVSLLGVGVQTLPVNLVASDVIVIVLSALIMSFVATLYPAYKAANTLPVEVLRNE